MKYCLAFVFLLALASTAPAEMQTSTGEAKCVVQGKVIQEPGKLALKKTTIQLIGRAQEGRANYSAVTDAEGLFKIEDVKPGRYSGSSCGDG